MDTYTDNYLTISGTPSAVESAVASLNAFMDEYEADADCSGGEEINRDIENSPKPTGGGNVELSCYVDGIGLEIALWTPEFGAGNTGEVAVDVICEEGCDRRVFKGENWEWIDSYGAQVEQSAFDLWCRAKSDPDADGVCAAILSNLSDPDMRQAFRSDPDDDPERFATAALLLQSIGRLAVGGSLSSANPTIKTLHKIIAILPTSVDILLGMGYNTGSDEDETLLRAAKAWAEAHILQTTMGTTKTKRVTSPRNAARRI